MPPPPRVCDTERHNLGKLCDRELIGGKADSRRGRLPEVFEESPQQVPGTLRDSLHLLAVVLEQETELQPAEIMSGTAGYTDTIFGIFHILGYRFSPRIAGIGGFWFWRVDRKADYGVLDDLASNKINIKLIVEQ